MNAALESLIRRLSLTLERQRRGVSDTEAQLDAAIAMRDREIQPTLAVQKPVK